MTGRDLGASVRQRLLNQARTQGRPFQELLQYFAMERFLYRLAKSPFADRFILKGALLLTAWRAPVARPTMDIDLAGKTNNELEHIRLLVGEVSWGECLMTSRGGMINVSGKRISAKASWEPFSTSSTTHQPTGLGRPLLRRVRLPSLMPSRSCCIVTAHR